MPQEEDDAASKEKTEARAAEGEDVKKEAEKEAAIQELSEPKKVGFHFSNAHLLL